MEAIRLGADVVLLDDGFQHLRLERDLDLVLIDAGDPWGGGRLPPLGRLREPVAALGRADAVVITKVPADWRPVVAEIEAEVDRVAPALQVFVSRVRPSRLRAPGWRVARTRQVCRAGRSSPLPALGAPVDLPTRSTRSAPRLSAPAGFRITTPTPTASLAEVLAAARRLRAIPVTTAKDAVKLPGDAGVWVVEVEMEPVEGNWNGLWRLLPEVRS